MPCSLIDSIESLYAAYLDLTTRCCPEMTPISPDQCALTSVRYLYETIQAMVTSESCGKLTATEGAPDPGQLPPCLNGDWLAACEAWIRGLSCTPTGICEPEETCVAVTAETIGDYIITGSLNAGLFSDIQAGFYSLYLRWNETLLAWEFMQTQEYPTGYEGVEFVWTSNAIDRCNPVGYYVAPPDVPGIDFHNATVTGFC